MSPKNISLHNFPVEVLQHIAGFLSPKYIFRLLLCYRIIHKFCDSDPVWRRTVQENLGFSHDVSLPLEIIWKHLALLDAKVRQLDFYKEDILSWLPQAMAFDRQRHLFSLVGN